MEILWAEKCCPHWESNPRPFNLDLLSFGLTILYGICVSLTKHLGPNWLQLTSGGPLSGHRKPNPECVHPAETNRLTNKLPLRSPANIYFHCTTRSSVFFYYRERSCQKFERKCILLSFLFKLDCCEWKLLILLWKPFLEDVNSVNLGFSPLVKF